MCYFRVCSRKIQYQQNDSGEKTRMFMHHNEKLCKIPVFTYSLVCSNYCIFQKSYIPDREGALIRSLAGLPILCAIHSQIRPFTTGLPGLYSLTASAPGLHSLTTGSPGLHSLTTGSPNCYSCPVSSVASASHNFAKYVQHDDSIIAAARAVSSFDRSSRHEISCSAKAAADFASRSFSEAQAS